jgi:hypothetical protein
MAKVGGPWAAAVNNKNNFSTGLSTEQKNALKNVDDPKERNRMMTQFALENHQQMIQFLSNIMKMMHESAMGLIRNIGG